jgi:hypothetical protein
MDLKSVSRVTHLLSTATLSGSIIINFMTDTEKLVNHPNFRSFWTWTSAALFVSGVLNIFLTKNGKKLKDPVHKIWIHFFEAKFILALFLTPLVYPLTSMLAEEGETQISEQLKNKIQFYIICFMFFYSPFIKYYREEVCLNFEVDVVMQKVKELQDRYELSSKSKDKPLPTDDSDIKRTLPKNPAPTSRHQRNEHHFAG